MNVDYFKKNGNALEYSEALVPMMRQLAEPLFSNTMINNFSYLKFYSDGSVVNLTTDINWIKYRFSENIKYKILFESELNNTSFDKPYIYLWPNEIDNKLMAALHHYGIWNGCNIYIASANQIEVFSFATDKNNTNMQSFYVNNLSVLNQYILYFRGHTSDLLKKEEKGQKIITDIRFPIITQSNQIHKSNTNFTPWIKDKLHKIQMDSNISLTSKEIECCYYLINGLSFKGIANKLAISPRTVESHINNVKIKTQCPTKELLICYLNYKRWIFDSLFTE